MAYYFECRWCGFKGPAPSSYRCPACGAPPKVTP